MADPKNALQYEYNAIGCNTKLDVQDAKIRTELTGCQRDTFVSFHKVSFDILVAGHAWCMLQDS